MFNSNLNQHHKIGMIYRRIQILVILSNNCFQTYIWPLIQFVGGMMLISVLYGLLVFHGRMPMIVTLCISLTIMSATFTICVILDLASRPILISGKIKQKLKSLGKCKWSQKFFRSCPKIALRVGNFHQMDRGRGPAFIRFVLQRTFFLVIKTKMSGCQHGC